MRFVEPNKEYIVTTRSRLNDGGNETFRLKVMGFQWKSWAKPGGQVPYGGGLVLVGVHAERGTQYSVPAKEIIDIKPVEPQ